MNIIEEYGALLLYIINDVNQRIIIKYWSIKEYFLSLTFIYLLLLGLNQYECLSITNKHFVFQ